MIQSLSLWIQKYKENNIKWALSIFKLRWVQSKIRNMPRHSFSSVNDCLISNGKDHANNEYISINDFKPILENYSSIRTISQNDSKLSDMNNYYSTCYSTTTQNGNSLQNRYQKIDLINKKKSRQTGDDDNVDKETFLQNWMTWEHSDFLPFQQYPKSNYCFKKIRSYNQQALDSVRKFTFQQFCLKSIKPEGFWLFKTSDRLKHSKETMSESLTYLNQIQTEKALQIFQCLLKAGGDIQSKQHCLYHVYKMLQILSSQSDDLFQETYLQIIKQMQSKKLVYLKVLCCFCVCVKPSARIYLPLLNYLGQQQSFSCNQNNITQQHYNYCFYHLIKNFDEPRLTLPSHYQLECFMHLKKIPVNVGFPREKVFYIEAYTKVEELIQQVVSFYDLDGSIEYLLLIDGCFMEKGILFDRLNLHQNLSNERKLKQYSKLKSLKALILLKNMDQYKRSKRCFNIMYNYYINQYLKGLFPLKEKQSVQIAALIMHSEMATEEEYYFDLKRLVSSRLRRKVETTPQQKKKYQNYILDQYFSFNGTKIQARKKTVDMLSKSKGFMTHFFKCAVFLDQLEEVDNWVGIKRDKFIFIDPQNGRFIRQIYYTQISEWGASKSQLCIKVDGLGKLHIDTLQVEVLTSIFQGYINYIYTQSSSFFTQYNQKKL